MVIDLFFGSLTAAMLVFCRCAGMILFNPLLSRRNLPNQFKMAIVLGLTAVMTPTVMGGMPVGMSSFELVFSMAMELLTGFTCGVVFQMFYYMLFMVGDVVDMGFGLAMAKAFDPGTNLQISMSGNIFQLLFTLYFFATDSHLLFIRLIYATYDIVSVGAITFGGEMGGFVVTLFTSTFMLAMHLALPFMATAMVMELSMGILMKLVPQINVFAIHFQLKVIVGMTLLFLFASPISEFMIEYIDALMLSTQRVFQVYA